MKHEELVRQVAERTGLDRWEAERTAASVLQALVDRLTGKEANDLLSQLPAPLKNEVIVSPEPQHMTADELVERVAQDLELSPDDARPRVRAVFATIREAVTPGEFRDVLEQLDPDYADLLA